MRPPRAGSAWSRGRVSRRLAYSHYMASPAWCARRQAWRAEQVARTGAEPVCEVCSAPWTLRSGDLHHRNYRHLGAEGHDELVALCRSCHESLHAIWDASPAWRALGRAQATAGIVAGLRRRHRRGDHPQEVLP